MPSHSSNQCQEIILVNGFVFFRLEMLVATFLVNISTPMMSGHFVIPSISEAKMVAKEIG